MRQPMMHHGTLPGFIEARTSPAGEFGSSTKAPSAACLVSECSRWQKNLAYLRSKSSRHDRSATRPRRAHRRLAHRHPDKRSKKLGLPLQDRRQEPFPAIGLATARERAGRAKDAIADGRRDPGAEKKAAKAAPTASASILDLVEEVAARFLSTNAKRHLKASTAAKPSGFLTRKLSNRGAGGGCRKSSGPTFTIFSMPSSSAGAPSAPTRTLAWLRRLCAWAVERGIVETSPCAGIKPPAAEGHGSGFFWITS
jgi:hypothetical protein